MPVKLDYLNNELDGFIVASLIDSESGLPMTTAGNGLDLDLTSAGNTEVLRAKRKVLDVLSLEQEIEDILITLS